MTPRHALCWARCRGECEVGPARSDRPSCGHQPPVASSELYRGDRKSWFQSAAHRDKRREWNVTKHSVLHPGIRCGGLRSRQACRYKDTSRATLATSRSRSHASPSAQSTSSVTSPSHDTGGGGIPSGSMLPPPFRRSAKHESSERLGYRRPIWLLDTEDPACGK